MVRLIGVSLVAGGRILDPQLVVLGQRIDHRDIDVAGVALLAIAAEVAQLHARPIGGFVFLRAPDLAVEAVRAAVQVVRAIVARKLIGDAV